MSHMVSLNQITTEAKVNFFNLLKKSWQEFQKNSKIYTGDDARSDFFGVFSESNLWLLIHLDMFSEMLDKQDKKISKYMNLNPRSRTHYLSQHDTINKIGYITKVMFDVEVFIKNIMKGLEKPAKGKYFDFTKQLLKNLNMYTEQNHKILNALYQLRNSLHNNGYAYHDFNITLRTRKYSFEKGKRIEFTGWDDLYIFFDELTDILIDIVKNLKLQKIGLIDHTSIREPKVSENNER